MIFDGPVRVAVLGAGVRGTEHDVPPEACFADWRELAERAVDAEEALTEALATGPTGPLRSLRLRLRQRRHRDAHGDRVQRDAAPATRISGTHDNIECDGYQVIVHDFRAHPETRVTTIDVSGRRTAGFSDEGVVDHGDGDRTAIAAFLTAVPTGDTSHIRSGPQESLDSHRAVWAAEHARLTNTVVTMMGETR